MSKTATLRIYSDIGSDEGEFSAHDMSDFLEQNKDAENYEIKIRSRGGSVRDGWDIYDLLKASGKSIKTVAEGMVYSIATVIFLAGDKDKREVAPNSDGLIHLPRISDPEGSYVADDFKGMAEYLEQEEAKILDLYVIETGQDREVLKDYMKKETMLSADDMVKLGFASKIAEPLKAVAYYKSNKNQMEKFDEKGFWDKFDEKVKNFSRLFAKDQELTDASGAKFKLEKESGEPAVGDKASPDGNYVMSSGKTIVVKDGAVSEVKEKTNDDELKALKAENETLKAKVTELETSNKAAKDAEASFKAKEVEAKALVTELTNLKNTWQPDGRTNDPGSNSTAKGIDLNKVAENLKKLKEAK
jgi:ATP-dependent Clp protease protease subunit